VQSSKGTIAGKAVSVANCLAMTLFTNQETVKARGYIRYEQLFVTALERKR